MNQHNTDQAHTWHHDVSKTKTQRKFTGGIVNYNYRYYTGLFVTCKYMYLKPFTLQTCVFNYRLYSFNFFFIYDYGHCGRKPSRAKTIQRLLPELPMSSQRESFPPPRPPLISTDTSKLLLNTVFQTKETMSKINMY